MKNIDWSKAPEAFPIWIEDLDPNNGGDLSGWHKELEDRYEDANSDYWSKPEEGYYVVHRRPLTSWNGVGLPPVGTNCEAYSVLSEEWYLVKIIDHQGSNGSAACRMLTNKLFWSYKFRPIRTSEQIEAEKREAAIAAIDALISAPWAV